VTLTASAPKQAPVIVHVDALADMKPVQVTLGKPHVLRARVVDAKGQPVEGAKLRLQSWQGMRTLDWAALTDRDGRMTWKNAPGDPLRVDVSKTGYSNIDGRELLPSGQEQILTLQKLGTIQLKAANQTPTSAPVQ
jgi:hypothetical protein